MGLVEPLLQNQLKVVLPHVSTRRRPGQAGGHSNGAVAAQFFPRRQASFAHRLLRCPLFRGVFLRLYQFRSHTSINSASVIRASVRAVRHFRDGSLISGAEGGRSRAFSRDSYFALLLSASRHSLSPCIRESRQRNYIVGKGCKVGFCPYTRPYPSNFGG